MEQDYGHDIRAKVAKHDKDLYHGNGNPGITTRMFLVEGEQRDMGAKIDKLTKSIDRMTWFLLTLAIATLVDILVKGK